MEVRKRKQVQCCENRVQRLFRCGIVSYICDWDIMHIEKWQRDWKLFLVIWIQMLLYLYPFSYENEVNSMNDIWYINSSCIVYVYVEFCFSLNFFTEKLCEYCFILSGCTFFYFVLIDAKQNSTVSSGVDSGHQQNIWQSFAVMSTYGDFSLNNSMNIPKGCIFRFYLNRCKAKSHCILWGWLGPSAEYMAVMLT